MPLREFLCEVCERKVEVLRRMNDYTPPLCPCGGDMLLLCSVPAMHVWNKDRSFPNVGNTGDGSMSFDTKTEYNMHLKSNHVAESATDAPSKVKLGAKVYR